jgi:aryl sulfotransferase
MASSMSCEADAPFKHGDIVTKWMDSTVWNLVQHRIGDVVIATYPRSGTTWTQQIVCRLLFQGMGDLDISRLSPWMELPAPNPTRLRWIADPRRRRFLKSHLPLDALPFNPRVKYITVMRDARDVAMSHYAMFYLPLRERNAGASPDPIDPRGYWARWLDRDPVLPYLHHIASWWSYRHLPNVKIIHYEALRADMEAGMRDIAAFLDIEIDATCWPETVRRCGFEHMKRNSASILALQNELAPSGVGRMVNQGKAGRWQDALTPADCEAYDDRLRRVLGEGCATWLTSGGREDARTAAGEERIIVPPEIRLQLWNSDWAHLAKEDAAALIGALAERTVRANQVNGVKSPLEGVELALSTLARRVPTRGGARNASGPLRA